MTPSLRDATQLSWALAPIIIYLTILARLWDQENSKTIVPSDNVLTHMTTTDPVRDLLRNKHALPNHIPPEGVNFVNLVMRMCPAFWSGEHPLKRVVLTASDPKFLIAVHPKGELVSDVLADSGTWNIKAATMLLDLVRPHAGEIILDVGANIGSLGLLWASAGFDVHSFEPTLANFDLIKCSAKLNGFYNTRMTPHRLAVGNSSTGTVCMSLDTDNMGASTALGVATEGCPSPTPQTTLDVFVGDRVEYFRRHLALLKIEVEGFEPLVLQGAQHILSSADLRPRILALELAASRWRLLGWSALDVLSLVTKHGYQVVYPDAAKTDLTTFLKEESEANPDIIFRYPPSPHT
jgi:FkbM family methyltransferase